MNNYHHKKHQLKVQSTGRKLIQLGHIANNLLGKKEKTFLMCLYCDKIIKKGGINRLKAHLAGGKGQVEQCKKVLADIPIQLKQNNARKC